MSVSLKVSCRWEMGPPKSPPFFGPYSNIITGPVGGAGQNDGLGSMLSRGRESS